MAPQNEWKRTEPKGANPFRFEQIASEADENIDVALGAALIARDVYEGIDISALLSRFDELAAPLVGLHLDRSSAEVQASVLGQYLFGEQGFSGNENDYYDPRNSLLPDVLDRRIGIPLTLSLVYCEVARRAGVPARGVGFPGHFLVRIDPPAASAGDVAGSLGEPPLFVDPFHAGRVVDDADIQKLLYRVLGPREPLKPEYLAPASHRAILSRMLTNLKTIYTARGEWSRALLVLDRLVSLNPENLAALRDRGLMAARAGALEAARADLARFLELSPRVEDAKPVQAELAALAGARRWLN